MKDPKAIRKAIMTARSIAAMVDPNFARVPLPQVGEPDTEEAKPPLNFMGGGYAAGGEVDQPTDYAAPNDMGLYSHAAVTAANAPQAKASPEEFRNILTNRGVKPAEFEASGYDKAFAGQPQVTREQVAAHFHENRVPIEEKGFYDKDHRQAQYDAAEKEYWDAARELMARKVAHHEANPDEDITGWGREEGDELRRQLREKRDVINASKDYPESAGDPHHEDFALPGGENYREILLKHGDEGGFGGVPGHFGDEPDVLASLRMKDRTDSEGNKVLHLDELQSDWGQQAKKSGIYSPKEHQEYLRDLEQRAVPSVAEEFGIPEETARAKIPEWARIEQKNVIYDPDLIVQYRFDGLDGLYKLGEKTFESIIIQPICYRTRYSERFGRKAL
jgi:hypothetical protein